MGDIVESVLKCWVGVKDSLNFIFGYGGLLDCFDVLMGVVIVFGVVLLVVDVIY